MKKVLNHATCMLVFTFLMSSAGFCQGQLYPDYAIAIKAAKDSFTHRHYQGAYNAYTEAVSSASTSIEKSGAYVGQAKSFANLYYDNRHQPKKYTTSKQYAAGAREIFLKAIALPGLPDENKAETYEAMGDYYYDKTTYDAGRMRTEQLDKALRLPNLSTPLKGRILLKNGLPRSLRTLMDGTEYPDSLRVTAYSAMAEQSGTFKDKGDTYLGILKLNTIDAKEKAAAVQKASAAYNSGNIIERIRTIPATMLGIKNVSVQDQVWAYRLAGEISLYDKNKAEAEKQFSKISRLNGLLAEDAIRAQLDIAASYARFKMYDEAAETYSGVLKTKKLSPKYEAHARYYRADAYNTKLDYKEARKEWKEIQKLKLDSADALYKTRALDAMARSYFSEKNYAEAARTFAEMADVKNGSVVEQQSGIYLAANAWGYAGDFDKKTELLKQLTTKKDNRVLANYKAVKDLLGIADSLKNDQVRLETFESVYPYWNDATSDAKMPYEQMKEVTTLKTEILSLFLRKTDVLAREMKYQTALNLYTSRLAKDKKITAYTRAKYLLDAADMCKALGKKDEAKKMYEEVMAIPEKSAISNFRSLAESRLKAL